MSFSRRVKEEIIENKPLHKHYGDAVAYGLILCSQIYEEEKIALTSKYKIVLDQFALSIRKILGQKTHIDYKESGNETTATLEGREHCQTLNSRISETRTQLERKPEKLGGFLAGAFLACGHITNPEKSYHLEFIAPKMEVGDYLHEMVSGALPSFKTMVRRGRKVVYSKQSEQIRDALTMMGASKATLQIIDVEMLKHAHNVANRLTNFETANIDKTVDASTLQVENIRLVLAYTQPSDISKILLDTVQIRLENPYASLRELAELFSPPISRSGLHHRLKQLGKMADDIRGGFNNK